MQVEINEELCAGSDLSIVNAARRSFDTEHKSFMAGDVRLLHFLIREGHWLPFRHPQLSFSCEAPVFVARQLGKHQVGMSWSETSRRYKTTRMKFWLPEQLREAPEGDIKQGTGPAIEPELNQALIAELEHIHWKLEEQYKGLLRYGVTPEQARAILPQSMYVYWTWTGSLLSWLHLIEERMHSTAQKETSDFVAMIVPHIASRFPHTWEAFEYYRGGKLTIPQPHQEL